MWSHGDVITTGDRIIALKKTIEAPKDQHAIIMRSRDGALKNMELFAAEAEAVENFNSATSDNGMAKHWFARRWRDNAQNAGI